MPTMTWTCLCPGLPALWVRGRWGGLAAAAAFAGLLNFALVATLAGDLLPMGGVSRWLVASAAWTLVLGFWVLGVRWGRRELSNCESAEPPGTDDSLREAQKQYLKAHWIEAETLLAQLLARQPEDIEARLLLASILRRTGRADEARRRLDELAATPAATQWRWEIESELARMSASRAAAETARRAA